MQITCIFLCQTLNNKLFNKQNIPYSNSLPDDIVQCKMNQQNVLPLSDRTHKEVEPSVIRYAVSTHLLQVKDTCHTQLPSSCPIPPPNLQEQKKEPWNIHSLISLSTIEENLLQAAVLDNNLLSFLLSGISHMEDGRSWNMVLVITPWSWPRLRSLHLDSSMKKKCILTSAYYLFKLNGSVTLFPHQNRFEEM